VGEIFFPTIYIFCIKFYLAKVVLNRIWDCGNLRYERELRKAFLKWGIPNELIDKLFERFIREYGRERKKLHTFIIPYKGDMSNLTQVAKIWF